MPQFGKFSMTTPKTMSGMATKNSMAYLFQRSPQKASDTMMQFMAQYRGKRLEDNLMALGVKEFDRNDEYTWDLIGSSRRNIALVEARATINGSAAVESDDNLGVAGSEFYMVFDEDWFEVGNKLVGERPDVYAVEIIGKQSEGVSRVVYTVQTRNGLVNGIPAEEFLPNQKFSHEFNVVSAEGSRERLGGNVTTPTDMRQDFTTIRYGSKALGTSGEYSFDKKVVMGLPYVDDAGKLKSFPSWMPYLQFKIESDFSLQKSRVLMFARSNKTISGTYLNTDFMSGRASAEGAGFREQMEVANTYYTSDFDIDFLTSVLTDLSESKLDFTDRLFIMKTGERGAIKFHKKAADKLSGYVASEFMGSTGNNPAVVSTVQSELHSNTIGFGYQIVEYRAPNGVILRVEVDPIYDDKERNKKDHPEGGKAESYRYDIFYIGNADKANMKIAKVKGQYDRRGYQWGPFDNPWTGEVGNGSAGTDEDIASMHIQCSLGSILYDPTKTASIIPSILRA